jgi:hypothetical protein
MPKRRAVSNPLFPIRPFTPGFPFGRVAIVRTFKLGGSLQMGLSLLGHRNATLDKGPDFFGFGHRGDDPPFDCRRFDRRLPVRLEESDVLVVISLCQNSAEVRLRIRARRWPSYGRPSAKSSMSHGSLVS